MAINVGTFLDEQSSAIEEVLSRDVEHFLPEHDPIYSKIVHASGGEGNSKLVGRDMLIKKTYYSGYTGVIDQAASRDEFVIYGDSTGSSASVGDKLFKQSLTQSWPDPTKGYNPKPIGLTIPMRASLTNLLWTLSELQAEALPAFIANNLSPKLRGFSNNVAHTNTNYLYLSQSDSYALFTLGTASSETEVISNSVLRVTPSNMACARLNPGMRLTGYNGTAIVRADTDIDGAVAGTGTDEIVVVAVDRLKNTVDLMWSDSTTWVITENFADSMLFAFPGSKTEDGNNNFLGYAGFNSWMKDSGNLLGDEAIPVSGGEGGGAINVQTHPEFKSGFWDFNGKALTEHRLRQIIRRFNMAHNPYGNTVDTLLGSDGVWMAYERQNHGKEMLDRTGRVASVQSGQGLEGDAYGGFKFTMDGKTYTGYTSGCIDAGTVYGIKTAGGNWKLITPPDYSGLQKDTSVGGNYAGFRFVGPALKGGGSVKMPIYDSSGTGNLSMITEGMQTPGMIRQQLVPEQAAGFKLTNVEEDRVYAD